MPIQFRKPPLDMDVVQTLLINKLFNHRIDGKTETHGHDDNLKVAMPAASRCEKTLKSRLMLVFELFEHQTVKSAGEKLLGN